MCRISGCTVPLSQQFKGLLFHELMMLSGGENWQKDGWGVTDGHKYYKSEGGYNIYDLKWKNSLIGETPWLGHVRAASIDTKLTVREAHPYAFRSFIGCHNGTMKGGVFTIRGTDPDTDSYRALSLLNDMIVNRAVESGEYFTNRGKPSASSLLAPNLITNWLNVFEKESTFVFALAFDNGEIAIIKGDGERTLWVMPDKQGGVWMNTNPTNLLSLAEWCESFRIYTGMATDGIVELPDNSVTIFRSGDSKFEPIPISYRLKEPPPKRKKKKGAVMVGRDVDFKVIDPIEL